MLIRLGYIKPVKIILVVIAVFIALASLIVSHSLVSELKVEERNKMEVWAQAMKTLNRADNNTDMTLVLKVLNSNNTIPVIVVEKNGSIQTSRNISNDNHHAEYLKSKLEQLKKINRKIRIYLNYSDLHSSTINDDNIDYIDIYYDESLMLKRLSYYPYIQLSVVVIFVFIAIFALLSSKKAEQNKVWVGLSKETAHQLGTPISSMMAWIEILKAKYANDKLISEMSNDMNRLEIIVDRFSKIGSVPEFIVTDLNETLRKSITYISKRMSSKVDFINHISDKPVLVRLSPSLFEWVIENLCKNSVDAMDGQGTIEINVKEYETKVCIDIQDTGKGIPKSKFGAVFSPGYTTKNRGWGLGLSLAKRIIEDYHQGEIYVKRSDINKGTTFRIELKK